MQDTMNTNLSFSLDTLLGVAEGAEDTAPASPSCGDSEKPLAGDADFPALDLAALLGADHPVEIPPKAHEVEEGSAPAQAKSSVDLDFLLGFGADAPSEESLPAGAPSEESLPVDAPSNASADAASHETARTQDARPSIRSKYADALAFAPVASDDRLEVVKKPEVVGSQGDGEPADRPVPAQGLKGAAPKPREQETRPERSSKKMEDCAQKVPETMGDSREKPFSKPKAVPSQVPGQKTEPRDDSKSGQPERNASKSCVEPVQPEACPPTKGSEPERQVAKPKAVQFENEDDWLWDEFVEKVPGGIRGRGEVDIASFDDARRHALASVAARSSELPVRLAPCEPKAVGVPSGIEVGEGPSVSQAKAVKPFRAMGPERSWARTALLYVAGVVLFLLALASTWYAVNASDGEPVVSGKPLTSFEGGSQAPSPASLTYRYAVKDSQGRQFEASERASFGVDDQWEGSCITVGVPDAEAGEYLIEEAKGQFGEAWLGGSVEEGRVRFDIASAGDAIGKDAYTRLLNANTADCRIED